MDPEKNEEKWDVVVLGAGSVGVPIAWFLAEAGKRVLVIDKDASVGSGQNKVAIGGIRATHGNREKILVCLESMEIFRQAKELTGVDIEWQEQGYLFPAWDENTEKILLSILPIQKSSGMDIDYVSAEKVRELVPDIVTEGLRGGTFSPNDGTASPMLSCNAFYTAALKAGAAFRFGETVTKIETVALPEGSAFLRKVVAVETDKGRYETEFAIDALGAGSEGPMLKESLGYELSVTCDSHEAGISEPVEHLFDPMIVDIRPGPKSKNCYFYQNKHNQVVFCLTPEPLILGQDCDETSEFLPLVSRRVIDIIPRLKNIHVRRTWRGLYPMTPDGLPYVGRSGFVDGMVHASGMCGQGYMMGPGIGKLVTRMLFNSQTQMDQQVLDALYPHREFAGATEALK